MEEKLRWLDENYLSAFDAIEVDSEIKYQKPFEEIRELEMEYSISSEESEEDNTYLSYNKVIGTSLDEKLYLAFQILDYALLSAPGAPLKKRFWMQESEKISWVLMTMESISRSFLLSLKMRVVIRKRHLSV